MVKNAVAVVKRNMPPFVALFAVTTGFHRLIFLIGTTAPSLIRVIGVDRIAIAFRWS